MSDSARAVLSRVETLAGEPVLVEVIDAAAPSGVRVEAFRGASHGSLSLLPAAPGALLPGSPDGPGEPAGRQAVFRYVPQGGFVGVDAFAYRLSGDAPGVMRWVEVRVWGVNRAPVAEADLVLVEGDGPVTIDVLANDRDPDGDALRVTAITLPTKGQLVLNADQSFTYWPGPGFFADATIGGHDSFTYRIRDIREPGDGQVGTAEAQVTLLRPAVPPPPNVPPIAMRDAVVTARDTAVTIDVMANVVDPDGDPLRVVGLTLPRHGSVALEADQSVTYTPEPGFVGIDDFTYIVDDGRGGRDTGIISVTVTE